MRSAASLLESLGHEVEHGFPSALADPSFTPRFMAMWGAMMALGIEGYGELLGRPLTEDEIEPVNWAQAEWAAKVSSTDYARALAAVAQFRRDAAPVVGRRLRPAADADAVRAAGAHR